MQSLFSEGSANLERELAGDLTGEPIARPAFGAILLHIAIAAVLLFYTFLGAFFHHNFWGSPGPTGSIQVSLVSSALPLPADHSNNDNVLATEKPSEAPAPSTPKAQQAVDETAIPISGKQQKITPNLTSLRQNRKIALSSASRPVQACPAPPWPSPQPPPSQSA